MFNLTFEEYIIMNMCWLNSVHDDLMINTDTMSYGLYKCDK